MLSPLAALALPSSADRPETEAPPPIPRAHSVPARSSSSAIDLLVEDRVVEDKDERKDREYLRHSAHRAREKETEFSGQALDQKLSPRIHRKEKRKIEGTQQRK